MSSSTTVPSTPVRDRVSYSINHSPRTPSTSAYTTPCTSSPFSGRSFSSTLTSPSSIKHSPRSPLYGKARKSVADLTDNWRERAQLNGIKVTAVETAQYTNEGGYMRLSQCFRPNILLSPPFGIFSEPISPFLGLNNRYVCANVTNGQ